MAIHLKHFRLIETVAQTGNLTRAAEKLFLSQSALSHQLADLEEELGVPVFHRASKNLTLTEAGKLMLETGEKISGELDRMQAQINKTTKKESGTIRICTECYTCYNWLPNVIKKMNVLYPGVEIQINTENPVKPLDLIRKKGAEVALVFRCEPDKNIIYTELFDDEMLAVVSRNNPLATKPYLLAKDFSRFHFITHIKNHEGSFINEKFFKPAGMKPIKVIHLQLTDAIIEMVKAGLGITIMNKWALKNYLNDKNLKFLRLTKNGFYRDWSFAVTKQNAGVNYINTFCKLIKDELKATS